MPVGGPGARGGAAPAFVRRAFPRRRFLRGAGGATLALPFLHPETARAQDVPKRLLLFFVAEGVERTTWWPKAPAGGVTPAANVQYTGTDLAPLEPFKSRVTVVKGLNLDATKPEQGKCYHDVGMRYVLTGGYGNGGRGNQIEHAGVVTMPGTSIDRFLGKYIKGPAPFATYEMGVVANGPADPWKIAMSYDQVGKARYPQDNPTRVFSDMFGGGDTSVDVRRRSSLDLLRGEIARLRCTVGKEGLAKLDAHLDGVRALEVQIDRLQAVRQSAPRPTIDQSLATRNRDHAATPAVLDAQMNLAVSMLSTDMSRIVTIQNMHTVSRQTFPWLTAASGFGDLHNAISHQIGAREVAARTAIYGWYAQQFAELLRRMDAVKEANGKSLLDNSLVVYLSEMSFGNEHNPNDIPTILAGGAQGAFKMGQYVQLAPARSYNDLWVSVANGFGVGIQKFGDLGFSQGPLTQLV